MGLLTLRGWHWPAVAKMLRTLLQRMARRYSRTNQPTAKALQSLLTEAPTADAPLRGLGNAAPVPLDMDSRLPLIRPDHLAPSETLLSAGVAEPLISFARSVWALTVSFGPGLTPSSSALFVGPPGVGKTLVARWIASRLDLPASCPRSVVCHE